ncbi:RNA polymerase sigma-70 factor, ECF subfamily [Thalassobacillus cyri]|uniref:RNA polymerase sigma-70 factor, ECF subfamily n=1 Tax=Thalassobacillus cyri TaxID=571932 RepID=A0A1H4CDD5_9BACI|nr:RNA polymerase sigma factor [Thalassobacillus cyri]SEA58465.1 RNA polymerase sigma-70 factor, ECF subfamily [Thalassobacillus cyri]
MEGLAYEEIYTTNYQKVYGAALRVVKNPYLAEEAAQEAFIKAYNNREKLEDINKLAAWLGQIATRTAIDIWRKERRKLIVPLDDLIDGSHKAAIGCNGVDKQVEELISHHQLMEELKHLAPKLHAVFMMKYFHGMKEVDIAERLEISISAVKSRAYRARMSLKKRLSQKGSTLSTS